MDDLKMRTDFMSIAGILFGSRSIFGILAWVFVLHLNVRFPSLKANGEYFAVRNRGYSLGLFGYITGIFRFALNSVGRFFPAPTDSDPVIGPNRTHGGALHISCREFLSLNIRAAKIFLTGPLGQ